MTEKDFWDMFHKKHNPKYYNANEKQFNKMQLAFPVNEGWLYNKDRFAIKLFASYDKDPVTNEITFGDRTMIPLACVKKMTKVH